MTMQPSWDKTGSMIVGSYMGIFPYRGIIESTRVCYGGEVQYTVRLLDHIEVYGDYRSTILVKRDKDMQDYTIEPSEPS